MEVMVTRRNLGGGNGAAYSGNGCKEEEKEFGRGLPWRE